LLAGQRQPAVIPLSRVSTPPARPFRFRADPRKPDPWLRRTKGASGGGVLGGVGLRSTSTPWPGRRPRISVNSTATGGLQAGVVAAWWIVAAKLGAQGVQVDQALRPRSQQPIAAQLTSVQAARMTWWSITPGPRTRLTAQQERLPAGWLV
jgi:hypothetical protein